VNSFLLCEDVRRHVGIPLALEVAEVNSGLEHLLECCVFHVYFPGLSNSLVVGSDFIRRVQRVWMLNNISIKRFLKEGGH
jgi:hypothetical protein